MKECKRKTISLGIICIMLLSFLQCHAQQERDKRFFLSEEIKFSGVYISPIQKGDSSGRNALAVGSLIKLRHNNGIGISYAPYLLVFSYITRIDYFI